MRSDLEGDHKNTKNRIKRKGRTAEAAVGSDMARSMLLAGLMWRRRKRR